MTLFEIQNDLLAANETLEENGNDLADPAFTAAIEAYFADLKTAEAEKIDGYIAWMKHLEMEQEAMSREMQEYQKKAASRAARVEHLKARLKQHMDRTGVTKLTTAKGRTLSVVKNGGKVPLVIVGGYTPDDVADEMVKVTKTFDQDAIRKALAEGRPIPFAKLGEPGTHLRIK